MVFENGVKNIQAAGYNGVSLKTPQHVLPWFEGMTIFWRNDTNTEGMTIKWKEWQKHRRNDNNAEGMI